MEALSDGAWRSVFCPCLALHFIAPNLPALMSRMASREIVMLPVLPMPPLRSVASSFSGSLICFSSSSSLPRRSRIASRDKTMPAQNRLRPAAAAVP